MVLLLMMNKPATFSIYIYPALRGLLAIRRS